MALTTEYKRSQLRLIYLRLAPAASKGLQAYLLDALQGLPSAVAGAGAVKSTAGAGHSVEFFGPSDGAVSPSDAASLYSDLLDLYDRARAALISAGVAEPTDELVYEEMMDRLQAVREVYDDYRDIRTGVPS